MTLKINFLYTRLTIDAYAVWCTGEHELYDLKKDPYEMKNLYNNANTRLVNRLDALLLSESSAANIGKEIPGDDFESLAVKVPKKLVETEVNWAEYGFYSSGN